MMNFDIKGLLSLYLNQLKVIVTKVPDELFSLSLTNDMFSLEMNAKIAANFLLRGYCPLIQVELVSFYSENSGKEAVLEQIASTKAYLENVPTLACFDDNELITDKAGFIEIRLPQSNFIHQYIIPNFSFHMSMVYAIARANGVALSKGDFDGLHSYPKVFSLVAS